MLVDLQVTVLVIQFMKLLNSPFIYVIIKMYADEFEAPFLVATDLLYAAEGKRLMTSDTVTVMWCQISS
jgi:hypothetical protein